LRKNLRTNKVHSSGSAHRLRAIYILHGYSAMPAGSLAKAGRDDPIPHRLKINPAGFPFFSLKILFLVNDCLTLKTAV
jgi:hypothetical protein